VTNENDIKMVVDTTIDRFGELHCLFNNAGGGQGLPNVTKVNREFIENTFRLNFDSMCFGMKYAIPHLKKQETSSIINNSSIAAKKAGFGDALYSAAKAAMDSYGRVAAMELARHGIRVNSVSPGATATPIFWSGSPGSKRGKTLSDEDNAWRQKKVENNIINNVSPLRIGRSGTGADIATAALFLASDDSAWYTGQDMIVDGGITTFDAPNKGWMADETPVDPVPLRSKPKPRL
jgi:NAD(P)-dependent dehydrogenase (short-subunit alcohol dehydrogenase family)